MFSVDNRGNPRINRQDYEVAGPFTKMNEQGHLLTRYILVRRSDGGRLGSQVCRGRKRDRGQQSLLHHCLQRLGRRRVRRLHFLRHTQSAARRGAATSPLGTLVGSAGHQAGGGVAWPFHGRHGRAIRAHLPPGGGTDRGGRRTDRSQPERTPRLGDSCLAGFPTASRGSDEDGQPLQRSETRAWSHRCARCSPRSRWSAPRGPDLSRQ